MLLYSEYPARHALDSLETADARLTGHLEALTVWVAALVQTHPDGERLRAVAQTLSARNPFRALCQHAEELAAYEATYCQLKSLCPRPALPLRAPLPPNV